MRKVIRRLVSAFFVILMLVSLFPFQVFAVDPVSAATMANALAQALTAYGASHGVSMMFDVSDTSGIGEGLHDLWGQFKADINDNNVPTYDSLAMTLWANLYTKVRNSVAINVSAENVGYFDKFWNWLLSGPAEMTRVDNQYYEWPLNSNNAVDPILVVSNSYFSLNGFALASLPASYQVENYYNNSYQFTAVWTFSSSSNVGMCFIRDTSDSNFYRSYLFSESNSSVPYTRSVVRSTGYTYSDNMTMSQHTGSIYYDNFSSISVSDATYGNALRNPDFGSIPVYVGDASDFTSVFGAISSSSTMQSLSDSVTVRPYVGDTAPQDVYIPDNEDVNYQPLPYVGPLDIPWDQTWGDGETITDAQGTSIADALDNAIADDGTLTLEGDDVVNPPADDVIGGPDSYQVPGLADVFPFCIPFDIYHFLQALSAEPTPPHFTATLAFPEAVGGSQQIDIDFDTPTFNQIAAILRTMELLAFCIGLALLTRSMFIRG